MKETMQKVEGGKEKGERGWGKSEGKKEELAIVLGNGGASKAVCYVLKQKNVPFLVISRKKTDETITYNEVTEQLIHRAKFIINTTPLGMFPNVNEMPQIHYTAFNKRHILIDLIYNPEETLFLKEGKKRGATVINGLTMFQVQAEASWRLFSQVPPNTF